MPAAPAAPRRRVRGAWVLELSTGGGSWGWRAPRCARVSGPLGCGWLLTPAPAQCAARLGLRRRHRPGWGTTPATVSGPGGAWGWFRAGGWLRRHSIRWSAGLGGAAVAGDPGLLEDPLPSSADSVVHGVGSEISSRGPGDGSQVYADLEHHLPVKAAYDVGNVLLEPGLHLRMGFQHTPHLRVAPPLCCSNRSLSNLCTIHGQPITHEFGTPQCCPRVPLPTQTPQDLSGEARIRSIQREMPQPLKSTLAFPRKQGIFNDLLGWMRHPVFKGLGVEGRSQHVTKPRLSSIFTQRRQVQRSRSHLRASESWESHSATAVFVVCRLRYRSNARLP